VAAALRPTCSASTRPATSARPRLPMKASATPPTTVTATVPRDEWIEHSTSSSDATPRARAMLPAIPLLVIYRLTFCVVCCVSCAVCRVSCAVCRVRAGNAGTGTEERLALSSEA
jgi:hypothetical protein